MFFSALHVKLKVLGWALCLLSAVLYLEHMQGITLGLQPEEIKTHKTKQWYLLWLRGGRRVPARISGPSRDTSSRTSHKAYKRKRRWLPDQGSLLTERVSERWIFDVSKTRRKRTDFSPCSQLLNVVFFFFFSLPCCLGILQITNRFLRWQTIMLKLNANLRQPLMKTDVGFIPRSKPPRVVTVAKMSCSFIRKSMAFGCSPQRAGCLQNPALLAGCPTQITAQAQFLALTLPTLLISCLVWLFQTIVIWHFIPAAERCVTCSGRFHQFGAVRESGRKWQSFLEICLGGMILTFDEIVFTVFFFLCIFSI